MPTAKLPVGAGAVTVPKVVKADRVGFALKVCLICLEQWTSPFPDKATSWGLSLLLSLIDKLAVRVPAAVGVNVIAMLQLLPAAALLPQGVGWVRAKSPGSVPVKVNGFIVKADVPVFVRTTDCGKLGVEFRYLLPKSRLVGTSMTVPVEIEMDAELVFVLSVTEMAVSVTGPLGGTAAGAVYVAAVPLGVVGGETVPQAGEQAVEFCVKVQFTPAAAGSFATVAVNGSDTFRGIRALVGDSVTVMAGTVIRAAPLTLVLKTDTAVRVTGRSLAGGVVGAM